MSGHDISDGGLVTCLVEMAISGVAGISVNFTNTSEYKSAAEVLFAEECGWILECEEVNVDNIMSLFKSSGITCTLIGYSDSCGKDAKVFYFFFFFSSPRIFVLISLISNLSYCTLFWIR